MGKKETITIPCPTCGGSGLERWERQLILGGNGLCHDCKGSGTDTFTK